MKNNPSQIILPFSDILAMLKHNKKLFIAFITISAFFAFFIVLLRPPTYTAEGILKVDEENSDKKNSSSVIQLIQKKESNNTDPTPIITSKQIVYPIIEKLNLQVVVQNKKQVPSLLGKTLNTLKENTLLSYRIFINNTTVTLPELPPSILKCSNIYFENELPETIIVSFINDNQYALYDKNKKQIGTGELGKLFKSEEYSFILSSTSLPPLKTPFLLKFYPKEIIAENIINRLKIEENEINSTFYNLSYSNRDRHFAAQLTNAFMDEYTNYLTKDIEKTFKEQINYLNKRQDQTQKRFDQELEKHKEAMTQWASLSGYLNYENSSKYLVQNQNTLNNKKTILEFEIKKLKEPGSFTTKLMDYDHSYSIKKLLLNIDELKEQKEQLSTLQKENETTTTQELENFEKLEEQITRLQRLIKDLKTESLPFSNSITKELAYFKIPEFLINKEAQNNNFIISYLQNNLSQYSLEQDAYREHLSQSQLGYIEFKGLDIKSAQKLAVELNNSITKSQVHSQQLQACMEQMQIENFELSSLNTLLTDSVSEQLIIKNTELTRRINNPTFYSSKEIARFKEHLSLEQNFLKLHIKQKIHLSLLFESLMKKKLNALHKITLSLLNNQITLYQKQIDEYALYKIQNFTLEKRLIEEEVYENIALMKELPNKWLFEKQINFRSEVGQERLRTLTNLVESTNLNNHLKKVTSGALDFAIAPIKANNNHLFIFTLLGAFFGLFVFGIFLFFKIMNKGVYVSKENLELTSISCLGSFLETFNSKKLTSLSQADLATIRQISHTLSHPKVTLFLQTDTLNYVNLVAELLHRSNKKCLLIECSFNKSTKNSSKLGLTSYLEGSATELPIETRNSFDFVPSGPYSNYLSELLSQEKMLSILETLKKKYSFILFSTDLHFTYSETQSLITLTDDVIINCHSKDLLNDIISFANTIEEKKLYCLLTAPKENRSKIFTPQFISKFRTFRAQKT